MVLPWLIVGASAAIEMRRREQPAVKDRERVRALRRLQTMERELSKQKTAFDEKFSATIKEMQESETMHDADRKKLEELQDVKQQYEERLMEITTVTESLQEENASLRADAQMWKERADAYLSENKALQSAAEDLRLQNGDLRAKLAELTDSNKEAIEELQRMIQDVKDSVADSLKAFTAGETTALQLQESLKEAGVAISVKPDELEALRDSPEKTQALTDVVADEFNSQLSLVMDDRARLEHFMGIAHGVRRGRDGANGAAASPSAASALTPRSESQSLSRASSAAAPLPTASLGVQSQASVGSGIFSLLQWGSRDVSAAASTATGAKEAAPSIAGTGKAGSADLGPFAALPAAAAAAAAAVTNGKAASDANGKSANNAWLGKGAKVKAKPRARAGSKKPSMQLDMPKDDDVAFTSKAITKV